LMERDPGEDIGRRYAMRSELWNRAAEEHLSPKSGSVANLAIGLRAWRHLEATDPVWREKDATVRPKNPSLEEIDKLFTFKKLRSQAMSFEEQYKKAFLTGGEEGRRFARQLSKAFAIPEDQISSKVTLAGSILLTWDAIMVQRLIDSTKGGHVDRNQPPKKREIRSLIERRMKELHLTPITDRTWQRVWQDPFIAALLRCP